MYIKVWTKGLRLIGLMVLLGVPYSLLNGQAGQKEDSPATVFPESLLEGTRNFGAALLLHADIRGNFGPCG